MEPAKNKIVVITGTSSGIGLSSAIALARAGCTVVATMRNLDRAGALQERAARDGVELLIRRCDVTSDGEVRTCLAGVAEQFGRVDVIVNNAGVGYLGTTEQTPFAELLRIMDSNFYGVWRMTQAALPLLRAAGSGRIVTVTSVGGVVGQPFNDAYCAAKFAVEGMMESLAPVARRFGVDVVLVEPGAVATAFIPNLDASLQARLHAEGDPYGALVRAYVAQATSQIGTAQTADEVAAVVVEAVLSRAPHLRYATSDAARALMEYKRKDPSGDALREFTSSWLR